jgi:monofunctional biosynthetic peptidoglycan transglycosylase
MHLYFLYLPKIIVLIPIMKNKRGRKQGVKQKSFKNRVLKLIKILFLYVPLLFIATSVFWILIHKWVPVWYTPLMAIRSFENIGDDSFNTHKKWMPLEKISPNMVMAVIASEDNRFMDHKGFDLIEINNALDAKKKGKRLRGASTISQQTAKNVFLVPSRSWVRKGMEAWFTVGIEYIWGKRRIMEVYLNVAEMGKGIYGAEAAAERLFGKTAQNLTQRECALIAATLPNPLRRRADRPGPYVSSRASDIQDLMYKVARPEWLNEKTKTKQTKR